MHEQAATAHHDGTAACAHCGKRNRVPASGEGVIRCGNCHEPLPWIAKADDDTFADVAERSSVPVLVDLGTRSCGPCDRVSPALEQVAREMAGRVKLVKVDVSRCPKTKARFSAQAVPSLLVLRAGEVINRRAGSAPAAALRAWVESTLARAT
jgi:thioredoxin 2